MPPPSETHSAFFRSGANFSSIAPSLLPAASFATMDPLTFENVVYLELTAGRPY